MKRTYMGLAIAVLFATTACGNGTTAAEATSAAEAATAVAAPADAASTAAVSGPATRDDVIAALRCHAVLSSAMANRIVKGDGTAVAGIREQTRWFSEAQRRSTAAGLTDAEFNTLMAETRAPMTTDSQRQENTPVMDACLANVPAA